MRGLFVTGTDTGVGKTIASACLLAAMRAAGEPVRAFKPVLTGLDDTPAPPWPADHELLALAAGTLPADVAPWRFGPAVSPHLAAELAGRELDPRVLVARARDLGVGHTLVVEGVGGLLVPLGSSFSVCDLAGELGLPVVVVARPGLGTINHTLLTLKAAAEAGLQVPGVVLSGWPREPSVLERSNRETIAALGAVEVATLPPLPGPDPGLLADAGAGLPWREWLS
jgi:dethiobiotin synthetase